MAEQHELKLFSGPGNPQLGDAVANWLNVKPGQMHYKQFADGENYVRFEESVRGADVYFMQPTCQRPLMAAKHYRSPETN